MDNPADSEGMAKLRAIAGLLEIPLGNFFVDREAVGHFEDVNECLRLWHRIKTAAGRRRALECLRALADAPVA